MGKNTIIYSEHLSFNGFIIINPFNRNATVVNTYSKNLISLIMHISPNLFAIKLAIAVVNL